MSTTDTHERATCLDEQRFQDQTITTTTEAASHRERVECPTCGREYEYVFEFEGVFDTDDQEYLPGSVVRSLLEDIHDVEPDGYTDSDGNYCLPHAERPRYERVYVLATLVDPESGEILQSF